MTTRLKLTYFACLQYHVNVMYNNSKHVFKWQNNERMKILYSSSLKFENKITNTTFLHHITIGYICMSFTSILVSLLLYRNVDSK